MREDYLTFTHSWVMNEYLKSVNQPAIVRRIDRIMAGGEVEEFGLANAVEREFVNTLDRCGALFRTSNFPMDLYVKMRGRYILTVWRSIEREVIRFRERAAMPAYANCLEWWAGVVSKEVEFATDNKQRERDRFEKNKMSYKW